MRAFYRHSSRLYRGEADLFQNKDKEPSKRRLIEGRLRSSSERCCIKTRSLSSSAMSCSLGMVSLALTSLTVTWRPYSKSAKTQQLDAKAQRTSSLGASIYWSRSRRRRSRRRTWAASSNSWTTTRQSTRPWWWMERRKKPSYRSLRRKTIWKALSICTRLSTSKCTHGCKTWFPTATASV